MAGSTPTKWMYASSGERLRAKPAEEAGQRAVVLGDERGVAEVDEEQLREHRRHRASTPPFVDHRDDATVVFRLGLPDQHHRLQRMQILVLGGTQFLGRHVVEAALARGHDVTLFNRGQTRPELFADVERLRGDRDGDLSALAGRTFDAVVDTSGYVPRIVERTIAALADPGHYTFVSSVSVYADLSTPPTESSAVRELAAPTEEWREAYGELKADCEDVVRARFPERVHRPSRADRRAVGPDRALHLLAAAHRGGRPGAGACCRPTRRRR